MKQFIIAFVCLITISIDTNAQEKNKEIVTDSISVYGICGMCEERIENAALIKGVKKVEWHKDEQMLHVTYRADKVSIEEIGQSIADAGHDNSIVNASDEAYEKVHSCCKYREDDVH